MITETSIKELKGIGEKTEKLFAKIGISTVGDMLRYYPRGYDIYEEPVPISDVREGQVVAVNGMIFGRVQVSGSRSLQVTTMHVKDLTGTIKVIWFRMPYLRNTFQKGGAVTLRGKIVRKRNELVMEHPEVFYPPEQYDGKKNTLQPIYGLTAGLSNHAIMKAMHQALDGMDLTRERLPKELRMRYELAEYNYAIRGIHFPEDKAVFMHARKRLVFEEFLQFILAIRKLKDKNEKLENEYVIPVHPDIDAFIAKLPYKLTNAQLRTWNEIEKDMSGSKVMNRLIQGDVGSGKTIVATLALISAALSGYQGAIMVPTEVLARQHLESINELIAENELNINTVLLTGSMKAKEKREAYAKIESGEVSIIIGTHALIQDSVNYKNLALVITDEQHRFGVRQRESIANKGSMPHIIVMSATPIPRTLAIIMYGDLDISIIDELPANRLPIKNCVVGTNYRPNAYKFIEQQVVQGRQAYIICPTVEFSEAIEGENVIDYCDTLKNIFPPYINIEYLHGKMKPAMKNEIMDRFAKNEIQILVSTTVVEVGVNVPNATVMMIENAERFGLAGLHQLRGRVGRGKYQSYCIFINASETKKASERLEILNHSNNGFEIANEDLKLRGPGDFFGVRQSGDMEFKLGDIYSDASILKTAADMVNRIEDGEIEVSDEEKQRLDEYIDKYIYSSGLNI